MSQKMSELTHEEFEALKQARVRPLNTWVLASAIAVAAGVFLGPESWQFALRVVAGVLCVVFGVWFWVTMKPVVIEEVRRSRVGSGR